jgi:hypothetical protein
VRVKCSGEGAGEPKCPADVIFNPKPSTSTLVSPKLPPYTFLNLPTPHA